jgi:uncharacterized OB-fold protein
MKSQQVPDTSHPDFATFWEGCRERRLLVPGCKNGHLNWPPRPVCQKCYEWNETWAEVPGRGCLYSWTVIHRTRLQLHVPSLPYVVGVVELAGPHTLRMLGRCEIEPSAAKAGLNLIVDFHDARPGVSVPFWRLVGGEAAPAIGQAGTG